ncbi:riboflavin synthase [Gloeobacter violaceus]|uniref:Riboflavin synthase n=1 Tax=Gloeobacter violaceus (strain ATCC 29082 / PCC 7421) TaxID=251221 RepID=Q7NFC2_GLOVI|nr:riboflavin synthase [Gloeobacter violaceus]BAC91545.1 riboflavin synthase alpha chain [Gloeobacter violaceus PCC 7421]
MFTGIVEETGTLLALGSEEIAVRAAKVLKDVALGDSISVDGICLTVVRFDRDSFTAGLSQETLDRTTLIGRIPGDAVNLESALRAGGKLGGHIVTGHIDGVGRCVAVHPAGLSWEIDFEAPPAVARYIVEKGSIAIDGISLTVAACNTAGDWFRVAIIPHSFAETTLGAIKPGDPVNLEADLIGKYVEKLLGGSKRDSQENLTPAFLAEHGFL